MMTSDSSSSPSSSGTEFADPNPSTDPGTNSERVQSQLESMNLSEPSEVSDGSHTDYGGGDDDDDDPAEEEVASANGNEGGVSNGLAGTSGDEEIEASSRAEHPVEMEAGEEPPSPTSSGYDGERGSSGGATSTDKADDASETEIREANVDGDTASQHEAAWLPGKRHVDEDDASVSWRKRKKHFFVLSNSGKPIYSRYGDEHKLAGFSATLQAIISFVENGGDRVNLVKAGKHQVVFLVKGPIYLVCISCTDETYEYLRGQLDLLYGQMILILTKSIDRCFEKNAKFDMTPLLGGTEAVFSSLVHSFSWNPATFLHAYTCLPLPYALRQATGTILQEVCASGVLFALLMCRHKVISLAGAQKASLHPDDLLLLSNFVMTSESFSPICLPRYNAQAFLHAYVHFFDDDTYVMLLTTRSEAFYHLKDCRIRIEAVLLKSNILSTVQRSIAEGGMRVEDLPIDRLLRKKPSSTPNPESLTDVSVGTGGPFGLWHFMYRSIYLDQYVSSEFSPPVTSHRQQKSLYRAYQKLYASMHDKGLGPHKTQYRRDENYTLLCWVTPDFELYAAFDPLADKAMAIKICNQVCQRVKDVENEVFLQGASPFSW
ncbi:unnamed protein product [Thlaspi arvense]|uniref:Vacuolar fusion protein MON1 homolog n=1 Tax=Thlaspi arvense TaxID=13288 RepID=A0AAU9S8P8_THLAR|nr:unnamed protein product [Thlaspi arvense]